MPALRQRTGSQQIGDTTHLVRAGTAIFLPPRVPHAFLRQANRRPVARPALQTSAVILRLLHLVLVGLGLTEPANADPASPIQLRIEKLLEQPGAATLSTGSLAQPAGYDHDYLNRLLKSQSGLTVGQVRALRQLTRAQQLLREARPVGDVAAAVCHRSTAPTVG